MNETTERTIVIPGMSVARNRTGFMAVDLSYRADPDGWDDGRIAATKAAVPAWKWAKEMERDWEAQSGIPVFDNTALAKQREGARNPFYYMDLDENGNLERRPHGRLRVFMDPRDQPRGLPSGMVGVTRSFAIGSDVSEGVGASDSTIEVFSVDTREQAAELADNMITPSQLGRFLVAVAKYYNNALICCVRKMHGLTVLREIVDSGYRNVWHSRIESRVFPKRAKDMGWPKGESSDEMFYDTYKNALESHELHLRSLACIEQHTQYIYDGSGRITHQGLADMPVTLRLRHGDMVIGCALAWRACVDAPKFKNVRMAQPDAIEQYILQRNRKNQSPWR